MPLQLGYTVRMTERWLMEPRIDPLQLSVPAVAGQLGVPAGQDAGTGFAGRLRKIAGILRDCSTPRGVVCELDSVGRSAICAEMEPEAVPLQVVERSSGWFGFVVSLGPGVDRELQRLMAEGRMTDALVLDGAASLLVESAADVLEMSCIRKFPEDGRRALRYSPGYCGWPVDGQNELFRRLQPREIGVSLQAGGRMEPAKTISGLILVADPAVHRRAGTWPICSACRRQGCREHCL